MSYVDPGWLWNPSLNAGVTVSRCNSHPDRVADAGAITGQIGYPANFVPPVTVYAVNQADSRIFFSVDTLRYPPATLLPGPQSTYTITGVVPGTYIVFAYRNDHDPYDFGGPAVYSQHLFKCVPPPATAICDDHTLVPVVVQAGQTVAGIDIKDWLNNVQKVTATAATLIVRALLAWWVGKVVLGVVLCEALP